MNDKPKFKKIGVVLAVIYLLMFFANNVFYNAFLAPRIVSQIAAEQMSNDDSIFAFNTARNTYRWFTALFSLGFFGSVFFTLADNRNYFIKKWRGKDEE